MAFKIDQVARKTALTRWVLPDCLHVPIAAVDESAIRDYVGVVEQILAKGCSNKALLVTAKVPPPVDPRLPISKLDASAILHRRTQVWVHVAYTRYRHAYKKAFPTEDIAGRVLAHTLNRRTAALKGFQYVRIVPISRAANSSSGALSETWGVARHSADERSPAERRAGAFIQYADLADLMQMMDMKVGGGYMDGVNKGQRLVRPEGR